MKFKPFIFPLVVGSSTISTASYGMISAYPIGQTPEGFHRDAPQLIGNAITFNEPVKFNPQPYVRYRRLVTEIAKLEAADRNLQENRLLNKKRAELERQKRKLGLA